MGIERVVFDEEILAIIVRREYSRPGIHFLTPDGFSQQLGYMQHPIGKIIQPHIHQAVPRAVTYTQEVLFIKKGRLRVDFYSRRQRYLESRILEAGDLILLASAGHGFEVLEELEMFEVKQGPYVEHEDKVRFDGIASGDVILRESDD
jgi:mannose-6-phosphate isomerase-like protein (cupin superfamily)